VFGQIVGGDSNMVRKLVWRTVAALAVVLGVIGVMLPGLPTVPFLLIAAWAASNGWPSLEARLLAHPEYGPMIVHWREHRAIPRRGKWLSTIFILISMTMLLVFPAPQLLRWSLLPFLLCVTLWVWSRPDA
jgi:uncharacterized membrane protein YbaN (DUF454 family)